MLFVALNDASSSGPAGPYPEVLEESDAGRRSFRFLQGPVFAQLLMADEINRASPRTQ